jgi:hypothetical protein
MPCVLRFALPWAKALRSVNVVAITAIFCPLAALGDTNTWNSPITLSGEYYFYPGLDAAEDNPPSCSERWQFNDDGRLSISSGQELSTGKFRTELQPNAHGTNADHWLIISVSQTNAQPDCKGNVESLPQDELRFIIWHANNGGVEMCKVEHLASTGNVATLRCLGALFLAHNANPTPSRAPSPE